LVPTYECWTDRRLAWLPPFPRMKGYARNRAPADHQGD
jgi:hypothetical protein